ncbi:MAG: 1-acyl-sn-glycerol-3-phosphate acyltransferase [Clostridia bacterium]|nr:1-acyl-sn-glycerol-3-phosphate acyltransferase [Clostridia bacterium]
MKKRHKIVWNILRAPVGLFLRLKFGYKYEIAKDLPENYIVLSNHVTDWDPVFVGVSFKRNMYLVGSEHISRWKFAYKLLKWGFEPILRPKGALASGTVMDIIRHCRKGKNVCLFAEGARSWDGITNPIAPATSKLIQSAKCGLVTYKITGGYFVSPMWSQSLRKGKISGKVQNVYTAEELSRLSTDEIYNIITSDLYEDAYARQIESPQKYKGRNIAEGLDKLLFICPECGSYETISAKGNTVSCSKCKMAFSYTEYGMLENTKFNTVKELSDWQKTEICNDALNGKEYFTENVSVSTVRNHIETQLTTGRFSMTKDSIKCGSVNISMADISDLAMHGQNALVFSVGKEYYEAITPKETNALKFMLYYQAVKNIKATEAVV